MKVNKKVFALCLAMMMLLLTITACKKETLEEPTTSTEKEADTTKETTGNSQTEEAVVQEEVIDPFMKYNPEITMTVGQFVGDDKMFPEGETPSENKAYSMVQNNIGIKFETMFTAPYGDPFNEKIRLQININEIPDFCTAQVADIEVLIKGEMIEDLAPYIEKYGSQALKDMIFYNDGVLVDPVTRGDAIYGLPATSDINNGVAVLYIRKDWMEKVGATEPKSFEDVVTIGKQFMEAGLAKYGIAFSNEANALPYTAMMNAYGAYPGAWIKGNDGKITNGSIAPEMKTALNGLRTLYTEGFIESEYVSKDSNKVIEGILANEVGIMIGEFWSPLWPLQSGVTADPTIDWNAYKIPAVGGGEAIPYAKIPVSGYAFVRKGYEHPEAAIIYLNHIIDDMYNPDTTRPFATELRASRSDEKYSGINIFSWLPLQVDRPDKNINWASNLVVAVDKKNPDMLLTPDEKDLYTKITSGLTENWGWAKTYLAGVPTAGSYEKLRYNDYTGAPTKSMLSQSGFTSSTEVEFVTKYIIGSIDEQEFDKYVEEWLSVGGQQMIEEINK